ncbi:TPA: hypothetical protein DCZ32_01635, partial [Candidatus Uhrbacteria bacterium]|nr:hypothetical protein [Candidatus Uhrbacteria bacterium]
AAPCTGGAGGAVSGADGACVFQPRVHVKDNWGYCTGVCEGALAGDACYDGTFEDQSNECDIEKYPSSGNSSTNPWVYYDGKVIVKP